ncbi:DUF3025 domain-containing protein [Acidovorax sp. NCPPB 3576]|uniref:DUF3025 domain-containing protein n=1 Tax=Acidovorax sp. NCPPB 3576 TaxID=2940488 RepID=UPI003FA4ABDF
MDAGARGTAPPWLQPFEGTGPAVRAAWRAGISLPDALNRMPGAARRFVPQSALPAGRAYEPFIFDTGTVPTRDNLHDFFNGLVWLRYPQAKRRLNALQAQAMAATGVGAVRGPLRDAITLFDENGAVLFAPAPLWQALAARDWRRLFVDLRPLWQHAQLMLFGHALLEKLESPRKPITAHVYQPLIAIESVADVDAWLAGALDAAHLAAKPFLPLPVLGVPGWWPENENFCFYDDSLVFRSARPA